MARGFGSTYGTDSNDRITTVFSSHATQRTYHLLVYGAGNGGGSLGRVFEKLTGGSQVELLYRQGADNTYAYQRTWSTSFGKWQCALPTDNVWHGLGVTYDGGSVSNDAQFYINGSSVSTSNITEPVGTLSTNADPYVIGNRGAGGRNFDGMLAEFGIWDVILDATEMAALGKGFSPQIIRPASLVYYEPMIRDNVNPRLAPATVTGALVQPHPRVFLGGDTR